MRLTTTEKYPHGAEGRDIEHLTGEYHRGCFEATALVEKLAEYEDAEEQGLLIRLPCKLRTPIFYVNMDCPHDYRPSSCTDHTGSCDTCHHRNPVVSSTIFDIQHIPFISSFGKTIFLTPAEAEEAVVEIRNNLQGGKHESLEEN